MVLVVCCKWLHFSSFPPSPLYSIELLAAKDFHTFYSYTLDNTDFDLDITSLTDERELLRYISHFTVAIFNSRDRSPTSCLPGVLIAGLFFTVLPDMPTPVTKGEVVMAMVDKDD